MTLPTRTLHWDGSAQASAEPLLEREWLVTNGLGGYAAGSVAGVATRRYHGLLVAALPAPYGRVVMLNHLSEALTFPDGRRVELGGEERLEGDLFTPGALHLQAFRLEGGLPVWRYGVDGVAVEKRLILVHHQNTVHLAYHLVKGREPVRLDLRPSLHVRPHEHEVDAPLEGPYSLKVTGDRCEVLLPADLPPLRLMLHGQRATLTLQQDTLRQVYYRAEAHRGYPSRGSLWSPGAFQADLLPGQPVELVASTEPWEVVLALDRDQARQAEQARRDRLIGAADPRARDGVPAELVLAADQFVITPAGRVEEAARAHAMGDEVRTVIAGYHWFTDWGRDTMISLEGLTLATGRTVEAGYILRTFAHYVRDGLIPNMFPEGNTEGLYHTADATLWFFHALHRYLQATDDRVTLRLVLPKLEQIVAAHLAGTHFGIGVDPADGLLKQGQEGYQLTWMDAKVDDWVVTPRRGKAVEINALWYNALRLLEGWLTEEGSAEAARAVAGHAKQAQRSFNQRFWFAEGGYLYDVIDGESGDDSVCRPNQLFAIALDHPVLDRARWEPVMEVVEQRLLTPVGLRSLAPGHPDYKARYFGDLRARDAAYHQGTVWGWLIGPFVDAWLKLHPEDPADARRFLEGFVPHLDDACIGSISEIFDADAPFTPRGCVAQAWSVAEVLRGWLKTSPQPSAISRQRDAVLPSPPPRIDAAPRRPAGTAATP